MDRILIIDDDRSIRELLAMHLEERGFGVLTAGTGNEGILRSSEPPSAAAIILAAWVGMDGTRIIRAPGSLEPTRALFTSVKASADSSGAGVYVFARAVPAWAYATTDWAATNRERLNAFLEAAGSTDSPGHENFARVGGVTDGEGEGLVTRAARRLPRNLTAAPRACRRAGVSCGASAHTY